MKRLLLCLALVSVHFVQAENPAKPITRVNRMRAADPNHFPKIEIDSEIFFKNDVDKVAFADYLGVGSGASVPSVGGNSGKWLTNNGTNAFWSTLPSPLIGITALTGGGSAFDAVSIVPYAVGAQVSFAISDQFYVFEVRDDAELPVEDLGLNVLPNTPDGTKYWGLHYSSNAQPGNGETFLNFGKQEITALSFSADNYITALQFSVSNGIPFTVNTYALNLSPAWNAGSNTMSLLYGRVTDTASNAGSWLVDLGTASGGQKIGVKKNGDLVMAGAITATATTTTGATTGNTVVANGLGGAGYVELYGQTSNVAIPLSTAKVRLFAKGIGGNPSSLVVAYDDGNPGGNVPASISFLSTVGGLRTYNFPLSSTDLMQYDSDLNALASNSANGFWSHISAGAGSARTFVAGSSKITITNGDGVSGNPSLDVVEANLNLANIGGTLPLATKVSGTLGVGNGGTGITSLATGMATWWGTSTSANLASTVTDETGSGGGHLLVFNQNPTLNGINVTGSNAALLSSSSGGATVQGTGSATAKITSAAGTTVEATSSGSITMNTGGSTRATLGSTGDWTLTGKATTYNNIATQGTGLPIIVKHTRVTGQSAANASICTYTAPASDGSYEVSANMNVTASTTLATTLTCTYTDEANTARTMILPVTSLNGTMVAAGAISGAGASVWETPVMHIRVKASTAITILTSAGTFTGVTYTAEGCIRQIQ